MPRRQKATPADIRAFASSGNLTCDKDELLSALDRGDLVEFEESLFNDPGEDYTALYLNGERVGYWPGY